MSQNYEIIELASEGYFYPIDHPLSCGKIKIYPITAKQEELLANINFARYGILEREFLNEIVVGGIDYDSLLHCDKESILLNLKIANYGPVSRIKTKCQSCEHEFEEDISFAFRSKPFNFFRYDKGKNELKHRLPVCKKEVHFRLPTCKEQRLYDDYSWLTFIKSVTSKVEGVEQEKIEDFYDYELGVMDSREFKNFYNKNTPGYMNEMSITCPSCGLNKKSKVSIELDIFGVSSQSLMNIHAEIFDLCYYSNGAFTQDGVYNMPTRLRSFYIKRLIEAKKEESDAHKKASKGGGSNKISRPAISKKG